MKIFGRSWDEHSDIGSQYIKSKLETGQVCLRHSPFNPLIDNEETLLLLSMVEVYFCWICSIFTSTFSSTFGISSSDKAIISGSETTCGWFEIVEDKISFDDWKIFDGIIKYLAFFFRHHVLMKPIALV